MSVLVFVKFFPKPDRHDRVEEILRGMVADTRKEAGCRRYDLFKSTAANGAGIFCLIETYLDAAAVQSHRETSHYKAYRTAIMELLETPPEVNLLDPLDAKPYA